MIYYIRIKRRTRIRDNKYINRRGEKMLFKNADQVTPCGMFSLGHLILFTITMISVVIALKKTRHVKQDNVKKIIRKSTIILWILEIIKIVFNIKNYGFKEVNKYVPLYFCSLILYAGIFSGFCKGTLKRIGDVFLSTGGIVAGMIFLISPLTSLTTYPAIHFISLHSFLLHGTMVYIGILMLITGYVKIEKKDIIYYSALIVIISVIAYIVNEFCGSSLMFISQNYPGIFLEIIYDSSGKLFPLIMVGVQATLPFCLVYEIYTSILDKKANKYKLEILDKSEEDKEVYMN